MRLFPISQNIFEFLRQAFSPVFLNLNFFPINFWSIKMVIVATRRARKLRKQRKNERKKQRRSQSPAPRQNLTEEKKSPANIRVEVNHLEISAKKEQEVSSQELVERPVVHVENKELGESSCSKVKTTASPLSKARRSSPHFLERRRITRYEHEYIQL